MGQTQSIQIQLRAIERDIAQLRNLHPEISSLMLVGVSYSTILGHLLIARHPEIMHFVDFSGIASIRHVPSLTENRSYPSILFIYGDNDVASHEPGRLELISQYGSRTAVRRLILADEGHFIQRRGDIDRILRELDRFLVPAQQARPEVRTGP